MDRGNQNFKNTFLSCNFRLDIFHSKTLLYSFWEVGNKVIDRF